MGLSRVQANFIPVRVVLRGKLIQKLLRKLSINHLTIAEVYRSSNNDYELDPRAEIQQVVFRSQSQLNHTIEWIKCVGRYPPKTCLSDVNNICVFLSTREGELYPFSSNWKPKKDSNNISIVIINSGQDLAVLWLRFHWLTLLNSEILPFKGCIFYK